MSTSPKAEPQAKAAHTAGPWEVNRHMQGATDNLVVVSLAPNGRGGWVSQISERTGMDGNRDAHWPEEQANARLIAAAPDLLSALRSLLATGVSDRTQAKAHAAIAKAEGRT